jgi:hypothetical protein
VKTVLSHSPCWYFSMKLENAIVPPLPLAGEGRSRSALHKSEMRDAARRQVRVAMAFPLTLSPLPSGRGDNNFYIKVTKKLFWEVEGLSPPLKVKR